MNKVVKVCVEDADFSRAITFKRDVKVFQAGVLIVTGKIKSFTDETVKINDDYFIRQNCKFIMS